MSRIGHVPRQPRSRRVLAPQQDVQIALSRHHESGSVHAPIGRAPQCGLRRSGILDRGDRAVHRIPQRIDLHTVDVGMDPVVHAHLVSGLRLAGDQVGMGCDRLAQHEESRGCAQLCEHIENHRCPARVGAVIEGEADLVMIGRALEEHAGRVSAGLRRTRRHTSRGRQVRVGIADGARPGSAADRKRRSSCESRPQNTTSTGMIR